MRSILEQAFVELLNENTQRAEELFHKFIVERARQIHESNRSGEDYVLDENWNDEITTESYFTEEDLSDLEDDDAEAGDEFADAESEFEDGENDMEDGENDMEDGEEDLDGLDGDDGEDFDMDGEEGMEGEGSPEERMEHAVDRMEELMAEFEAKMAELDGGLGDDEADMDADADDMDMDADDMDADVDDFDADADMDDEDMDMADDVADDMDGAEDEDEFDDISESIIDELEKVKVTMTDGEGVGTGGAVGQNRKSVGMQKNITARQGGSPNMSKQSTHKGFARETAPTVAPIKIKARNNNGPKLEKISKEGSAKAELNKPGTRAGEKVTGSPIDGKNGGKVK